MPPLEANLSWSDSCRIRLIGLKASAKEGLSVAGFGFLPELKKFAGAAGVLGVDMLVLLLVAGPVLAGPVGVNVLAAGFGLNSMAFTLNLVDALEVGLAMPSEAAAGPVGMRRS